MATNLTEREQWIANESIECYRSTDAIPERKEVAIMAMLVFLEDAPPPPTCATCRYHEADDDQMDARRKLELRGLVNRYSLENGSDTPDFILAAFLMRCLDAFERTTNEREKWYGRGPAPVDTEAGKPD